jgi:hypothetical protein
MTPIFNPNIGFPEIIQDKTMVSIVPTNLHVMAFAKCLLCELSLTF